ncbi:hypothetical protein [Flavobacteriaceae bacterium 14752]|uniref:hypothetical protein n=1 Tax=Mesohalobacter salilacus TaxID=2491711 RepID=UPI000F638273|nr:hypothetical protein EIG84_03090 [Flavobacteriaceae bacterium 14752]
MKVVIQIVLWIAIVVLVYLNYKSIYGPVEFNKKKEQRYAKVIEKMDKIRKAQLAHRDVVGKFTSSFDSLTRFIDTAEFTLTQRRDTTYLDKEYLKTYGVDKMVEDVVIDTLGTVKVKDSLFKNYDYSKLEIVPTTEDTKFEMDAGYVTVNNNRVPVFEAKVNKSIILEGLDPELIIQEKQTVSVDGVNGPYIKVGSMNEVDTSGNWPINYGKQE